MSDLQTQLFDARDEIARKSDLLRQASERVNTAEDALKESNQRIKNFYTRENARTVLEEKIKALEEENRSIKVKMNMARSYLNLEAK